MIITNKYKSYVKTAKYKAKCVGMKKKRRKSFFYPFNPKNVELSKILNKYIFY